LGQNKAKQGIPFLKDVCFDPHCRGLPGPTTFKNKGFPFCENKKSGRRQQSAEHMYFSL